MLMARSKRLDVRFEVRMPEDLKDRALDKANATPWTLAEITRWLIEAWVSGEIEVKQPRIDVSQN